jgi:beta-glucuronidase
MRQTFAYLHQLGAHITRTHCPLNPYEL